MTTTLPNEILYQIMTWADYQTILRFARTSKMYQPILHDTTFWEQKAYQEFGVKPYRFRRIKLPKWSQANPLIYRYLSLLGKRSYFPGCQEIIHGPRYVRLATKAGIKVEIAMDDMFMYGLMWLTAYQGDQERCLQLLQPPRTNVYYSYIDLIQAGLEGAMDREDPELFRTLFRWFVEHPPTHDEISDQTIGPYFMAVQYGFDEFLPPEIFVPIENDTQNPPAGSNQEPVIVTLARRGAVMGAGSALRYDLLERLVTCLPDVYSQSIYWGLGLSGVVMGKVTVEKEPTDRIEERFALIEKLLQKGAATDLSFVMKFCLHNGNWELVKEMVELQGEVPVEFLAKVAEIGSLDQVKYLVEKMEQEKDMELGIETTDRSLEAGLEIVDEDPVEGEDLPQGIDLNSFRYGGGHGLLINVRQFDLDYTLQKAIYREGNEEGHQVVRYLLEKGADVNVGLEEIARLQEMTYVDDLIQAPGFDIEHAIKIAKQFKYPELEEYIQREDFS